MKKFVMTAAAVLFLTGIVSAADINLGGFPVSGKWADPEWGALWEISSSDNTIRILDAKTGKVYADFAKIAIEEFNVDIGLSGATITWSCKATSREYKIFKGTGLNTDIELTVTPTWKQDPYTVTMKMESNSLF
jgi:hypothetical protein